MILSQSLDAGRFSVAGLRRCNAAVARPFFGPLSVIVAAVLGRVVASPGQLLGGCDATALTGDHRRVVMADFVSMIGQPLA